MNHMRKIVHAAGFTLIELLIVVAVIGIIAAIAIPGLLRARQSGNEASAIASLRVVNSSQQVYMASCGNGFYAASLPVLAEPPSTGGTPFISPDLGTTVSIKSGYRLTMAAGSEATNALLNGCNAAGTAANLATSYYATNQPLVGGVTGSRWFFTNALGALFASSADDFDAETVGNAKPSVGLPLQ